MTDRFTVSVRWSRGLRRAVTVTVVALLGVSPTISGRVASDASPIAPPPRAPELRLWIDGEEHAALGRVSLEQLWRLLTSTAPGVHDVVLQRCESSAHCRVLRVLVETAR